MTDIDRKAATTLSTRASKSLDAMRATIARADEARSDAAHQARAAHVVDARAEPSRRTVRLSRPGTRWRPARRPRRATAGAGQRWPIVPCTAGRVRQRWRAPLPSSVSEVEIVASVDW